MTEFHGHKDHAKHSQREKVTAMVGHSRHHENHADKAERLSKEDPALHARQPGHPDLVDRAMGPNESQEKE